MSVTSSARVGYGKPMPRGVYKRSEAQLEGMRQRFREQGAKTRPSKEARERMAQERTEHGHAGSRLNGRRQGTPTYETWCAMIKRCTNPNNDAYPRYGGRGITVCERWLKFENFLADMGERPDGLTIERIDNDGNYEPSNCRWATYKEQARNTRANRRITMGGETKCVSEWADQYGIKMRTVWARLRMGWTIEKALTAPIRRR